jgi:hypothetical protein
MKAASASLLVNSPASENGCGTHAQKQPPDRSTRPASVTAAGMSSTSIRLLYDTTRSKLASSNGSAAASPTTYVPDGSASRAASTRVGATSRPVTS